MNMIFVVMAGVVVGVSVGVLIGRRSRRQEVSSPGNEHPDDDSTGLGTEELAVVLRGAIDQLDIGIVVASAGAR